MSIRNVASLRARLAASLAVLSLLVGCSDTSSSDSADRSAATTAAPTTTTVQRDAPVATLSGPITGGTTGVPFNSMPEDLAARYGYEEHEYFATGTARSFRVAGTWDEQGHWPADAGGPTGDYVTRLVVRRPTDPKRFNGTVVLEWHNVSAGLEADPDFGLGHEELLRSGFVHVGVSVQRTGIEGGGGLIEIPNFHAPPLKEVDPQRYAPLHHPGDEFSYDIFSQVAAAIRQPGSVDALGGLRPTALIAAGESQSADRMTTYVNAIQPLTRMFDGFLIHSRFAGGAPLNADRSVPQPARTFIRADLGVPVLQLETETDLFKLGFAPAREPDTSQLRTWEIAGASHADRKVVDYGILSGRRSLPDANFDIAAACGPVNDGPQTYVVRAAFAALHAWVSRGEAPAKVAPIETADGAIVRDPDGNARGGVRTPAVDAATTRLSGETNAAGGIFCDIFGSTEPLSADTLRARYPTHESYVDAVNASADASVAAGTLLPPDRDEIVAAAKSAAPF